jgi:DUF2961 family protein
VNYYVDNPSPMWYGEGDDMFFIDGERWPPSLHGTGTEDYFNTSWSPNALFQHPYYGYARVPSGTGSRKPMPSITEVDIHLWRDAWRKAHGSKPRLWGNEKEK